MGANFLKANQIPATRHLFFQFFQRYFKVEAAFSYSGNVIINIFHSASANKFSA